MENPFIITGYIKPEYFCDRKQEAKRIITKITNGENIVIMAARRVGKSKLIDFCLDSPTIKDNFISISIDILRTSSINEFAFELGKAVFEQAARRSSKLLKMVVNTLKSINGCFGYDPISNTPTFNLSLGDISNPLYTLEEIFACLEQADKKCIVAIDEFQQIGYYPEKNMEAVLRTYIQRCSNANFIFSGSERHLITEMFSEKARPFYNSADIMNLDVIPIDKYTEFAIGLFHHFDKDIQARMFELLGFTPEQAEAQFGFLMNAFKYGAPPHGGLAFGFDRFVSILDGSETIRDYIAFPKNNSGRDVMIDAPSAIADEQMVELNIKSTFVGK